jgi:uncharacterized protein
MAENYQTPGVYIREVDTGPKPIEGVGTAVAAFVGFAAYSDAENTNRPVMVTSWSDYVRMFGKPLTEDPTGPRDPHRPGAYLSHAVYGYFLNGGGRCYITNVVPPRENGAVTPVSKQIPAAAVDALPAFTIAHKAAPGSESLPDVQVTISPASGEDAGEGAFTLRVQSGDEVEEYPNVVVDGNKNPRSVQKQVNQRSKLVTITEVSTASTAPERLPGMGSFLLSAVEVTNLAVVKPAHLVGQVAERSGIEGMEIADDVTMVCAPDLMALYETGAIDEDGLRGVQMAMINHAEMMQDRMAILDCPPGLKPDVMNKWRIDAKYDSMYAAMYYPWITIMGPDGKAMEVPPCGHIAGVYARSDGERGVHKAPANEIVRGVLRPAREITAREQEVLNPIGVNCIRSFGERGVRIWGARTLSSNASWRYINVRRLFNYIEKSIERGTQWVVFEPNDPNLWARVRRDVSAFLTVCWRDGMLFGLSPNEAFFVKCDAELNTPEMRDLGKLVIEVGISPVKPAEFVIFRFSQFVGGGA